MGLSRAATIIDAIRAEAANTMLLDNGDFLQGSPMGDYIAYERGMKAGDVHPVIKGMNVLGFDCSTLGNHEFNYGLDFMGKVLAGANFPFVSANLINGTTPAANPRTMRCSSSPRHRRNVTNGNGDDHRPDRHIGFLPPQIMVWDDFSAARSPPATSWERAPGSPRSRSRADIVIALSTPESMRTSAHGERLAFPCRGGRIGVILTGHQHLVFRATRLSKSGSATKERTPASLAYRPFWGSHLGIVDLLLERQGEPGKSSRQSEARPIYERSTAERSLVGDVADVVASVEVPRRALTMSGDRSARPRRRSSAAARWSPTIPRFRSSTRRSRGTWRGC
jgi:2',3'-cyclic-nucleotide 2'-phosphodiesterase/3'-nucleotidase